MNIKKIYLFFIPSAILCVIARFYQLFCGIEPATGMSLRNAASYIFPILAVISVIAIFFISKFSYGVEKISEFEIPTAFSPALLLLGIAFILEAALSIGDISNSRFVFLSASEVVLAALSGIGMIILGVAVLKNSNRSISLLMFCPVLLYSVKLINLFMSTVSIVNNLSISLSLFKIISMLLFYLYTLNFLFNPEMKKSVSGVISYAFTAIIITLSDIIPSYVFKIMNPEEYSAVISEISVPDLFFCIYATVFGIAVINSVAKKSIALKSKTTEE